MEDKDSLQEVLLQRSVVLQQLLVDKELFWEAQDHLQVELHWLMQEQEAYLEELVKLKEELQVDKEDPAFLEEVVLELEEVRLHMQELDPWLMASQPVLEESELAMEDMGKSKVAKDMGKVESALLEELGDCLDSKQVNPV